jgi:hypothetical protein
MPRRSNSWLPARVKPCTLCRLSAARLLAARLAGDGERFGRLRDALDRLLTGVADALKHLRDVVEQIELVRQVLNIELVQLQAEADRVVARLQYQRLANALGNALGFVCRRFSARVQRADIGVHRLAHQRSGLIRLQPEGDAPVDLRNSGLVLVQRGLRILAQRFEQSLVRFGQSLRCAAPLFVQLQLLLLGVEGLRQSEDLGLLLSIDRAVEASGDRGARFLNVGDSAV